MDEPINPLETEPTNAGDLTELPAAEPLEAPLSDAELAGEQPAPAPEQPAPVTPIDRNGRQPGLHDVEAALRARQAAQDAARAPGPVVGNIAHLGAIQSDVEQLHAEATSTRRAVQLLALTIGAVAALILVYAIRARAGAGTQAAPAVPGAGS